MNNPETTPQTWTRKEAEANLFALHLLAPNIDLLANGRKSYDVINALSNVYGISTISIRNYLNA